MDLFGQRPLESFFPTLVAVPSVQDALREEFHERAVEILNKLGAGLPISGDELSAHDVISDLVRNESTVVDAIDGLGYSGEFPIHIMQFGLVYWIDASEHDPIGYFETMQSARDCAEFNYEPFITAVAEEKEHKR
jgi:hypothetical protein